MTIRPGGSIVPFSSSVDNHNKSISASAADTVAAATSVSTTIGDDFSAREDWETNGGIIEGVWVFVRHGDRTPSRPLSPPHKVMEESEFWRRKLPRPDPMEAFQTFCHRYPPRIHPSNNNNKNTNSSGGGSSDNSSKSDNNSNNNDNQNNSNNNDEGQFLDVKRAPFGFLTHTGVQQMHELGSRLFNRYDRHGYRQQQQRRQRQQPTTTQEEDRSDDPSKREEEDEDSRTKQKGGEGRSAYDFLTAWDVNVYSTNYLRTIMSAQSFLDGLLGTRCYLSLGDKIRKHILRTGSDGDDDNGNDVVQRDYYEGSLRIPDHQSFPDPARDGGMGEVAVDDHDSDNDNENDDASVSDGAILKIQIRGPDEDTLNAFDRAPELMAELVSTVISSKEFQERDGAAAPSAARLANILPGLARKKKDTAGFNAAPSGINWIEACDHFVCRTAHNLEFSRFSDFEHDEHVETILQAMAHQTMTHLAWRFRQWYKNPTLLATIAAPPLREIWNQLQAAKSLSGTDQHPFTLYSCHDVTILGLLYGIGADFLAGDDDTGGWRYWPPYASTLVFELVRIPPYVVVGEGGEVGQGGAGGEHVVRILLNGVPIKTLIKDDRFWHGDSLPAGNGPFQMLYPKDFDAIITRLEKAGGFSDYMCRDNTTTNRKGDMSNWTG